MGYSPEQAKEAIEKKTVFHICIFRRLKQSCTAEEDRKKRNQAEPQGDMHHYHLCMLSWNWTGPPLMILKVSVD